MFCKLIIISIIVIITLCGQPGHAEYWSYLNFNKGDILECRMNPFAVHDLLATSDSDVAHMVGDKTSGSGYLWEEPWERYHRREGNQQTDCWVRDSANNACDAVNKARQDIEKFRGRKIYYNLLTCNCEHWVRKWAKGRALSYQSLLVPTSQCDVNNRRSTFNNILDATGLEREGKKVEDTTKDVVEKGIGFFKSLFGK